MSERRPSYASVLRIPGIRLAFLPSLVGRLSLATSGLALVLHIENATASFAVAGAVTAALGVANVLATPWRSRLVDRFGHLRVLPWLGGMHAVSLIVLAVFVAVPLPVLLVIGVFAGATSPPFGAVMRVVWSANLPAGALRTRGFSLDAVAEEVTFAAGPLAAAALAVFLDPLAALVLSAVCVVVGSGLFVLSPLSRAQRGSRRSGPMATATSPLRTRGFVPVICVMVAPGLVLGAIELAAPALALEADAPILAGVLLAVFAASSALGGLVFGAARLPGTRSSQLVVLTLALVLFTGVTGAIGGVTAGLVGFGSAGVFIAPLLIVGYLRADDLTDPRVRTEASSWINTAVNLGAAVGALVYGAAADAVPSGWALVGAAAVAGALAAGVAPFLLRRPRGSDGRAGNAKTPA